MTDWAIDANIVMQQAVRRLLSACVEYTNGRIFVPERALALACTHYRSIARRRARRITRPDNPNAGRDTVARLAGLKRFTEALHHGGAVRSAEALDEVLTRGQTDPAKLGTKLERPGLRGRIERMQAAERRQVRAERAAIEATTETSSPCPSPTRSPGRED